MLNFEIDSDAYRKAIDRSIGFVGRGYDFFTRAKARILDELIAENFANREVVEALNVGCGTGFIQQWVMSPKLRIFGMDVAAAPLKTAREGVRHMSCLQYDGERFPFRDASFDLTLTICVLHHVSPRGWPAFLAELHRITRPCGLACIIEHNPLNPLTRLAVYRCTLDKDAVLLRAGTVRRLCEEAGYQDTHVRNFLFLPSESGIAGWVERRLAWLAFGAQYCLIARRPSYSSRE